MSITRRTFVRAGAVSALFAGLNLSPAKLIFAQEKNVPGAGGFTVPYEAKTEAPYYFTHETFVPYLNSTFRISSAAKGAAFDATLVQVFDYQAQARARKMKTHAGECFSLSFRAGERDTVSQGIYKLSHSALGRFSLFIVPGTPSAEGTMYTAVVNHFA
jgi:hypothetical protein